MSSETYRVTWDGRLGTVRVHGRDTYFGHPLENGVVPADVFQNCLTESGMKALTDAVIAIGEMQLGDSRRFEVVQRAADGTWWKVLAHAVPMDWDEQGQCILSEATIRGEPCDPPADAPT